MVAQSEHLVAPPHHGQSDNIDNSMAAEIVAGTKKGTEEEPSFPSAHGSLDRRPQALQVPWQRDPYPRKPRLSAT